MSKLDEQTISSVPFSERDGFTPALTEEQAEIVTSDIPPEDVDLIKVAPGTFASYCKWQKTVDILNKSTWWNWDYVITNQKGPFLNELTGHQEVRVDGILRVYTNNGVREYHGFGNEIIDKGRDKKVNPNMSEADWFEGATSRFIRKTAMRFGIGLQLSNEKNHQRNLTHHGEQKKPTSAQFKELTDTFGCTLDELPEALNLLDIKIEPWELKNYYQMNIICDRVDAMDTIKTTNSEELSL